MGINRTKPLQNVAEAAMSSGWCNILPRGDVVTQSETFPKRRHVAEFQCFADFNI